MTDSPEESLPRRTDQPRCSQASLVPRVIGDEIVTVPRDPMIREETAAWWRTLVGAVSTP
jgi:hypothetical protein